ncbi:hypothetical protein ASG14_10435 [Pedobacter sp. Leaf194]|nr:hypothetical protein ASG14_10435 [Pedobacter sp. Leaf194]
MDNSEQLNLLLVKLTNLQLRQQGFEAEIFASKQPVEALQHETGCIAERQNPFPVKIAVQTKNSPPIVYRRESNLQDWYPHINI